MKTIEQIRALVGSLPAGTTPLALLPVQVQTRFVTRDGVRQLLVRVYPDEIHLDGHEPGLTASESEWGRRYWELIWPAARDPNALRPAWEALADRFGARRAAWVARRTTPTNLDARPSADPVFPDTGSPRDEDASPPVLARALPERWVVMGYRGTERVLLAAGAPIPAALAVSPGADEPGAPLPPDHELALDPRMRWMVDFEEAERIGMGIRVDSPGDGRLDTLLVFGVRSGPTPEAGAALLEGVLDAHHYTSGLAFVAPQTPTNNTAEAPSGFRRGDSGGFEVEVAPARLAAGADGAEVARLVGLSRELFASVEGAARLEDVAARRLHAALWPVTGGNYLEQMVGGLTPSELEAGRRFFVDFVRAQGPLPALRVGRQPYGLLPVMSLDGFAGTPAGRGRLVETLRALRGVWREGLARVPRLLPGAQDEEQLVEILRMQPAAVGHRVRPAFDREALAPGSLVAGDLAADLREHASLLHGRLDPLIANGLLHVPRVFDVIPGRTAQQLPAGALVAGAGGSTAAAIKFLRTATFDDLLAQRLDPAPDTLLFALLRHSVLLAQAGAARRILIRRGALADAPYREPVLVDIVGATTPDRTQTLPRVLDLDPALRASIHALTPAQAPEAAALDELRRGLAHLETMPVDALERHLAGCLDLFGHRLDAWITALATRRLNEIRRQSARGIAIGGFGWVENLSPDVRTPVAPPPGEEGAPLFAAAERGGAIPAPSLGQAAAAAVLRSGYLAGSAENGTRPFAVDLSSARVRLAEFLLDGVRAGQRLEDLLGYRFERALHERRLDAFIMPFRRERLADIYLVEQVLADIRAGRTSGLPPGLTTMGEVTAFYVRVRATLRERHGWPEAADRPTLERLADSLVADGLALARSFRSRQVPWQRVAPNATAAQRTLLEAELGRLDECVDGLSDALTAESVYQLVRGNPARASASVDAVAHGDVRPPELEVVRTPRPGTAVTHLLVVLFSSLPAAPAGGTTAAAGARGARAKAEPTLDLWLRQMVGETRNVVYRAEFVDAAGDVILRRDDQRLGALVASPLDALYLSAAAQPGSPSDLERLLEYAQRRGAPASIPADARLRLVVERPPQLDPTLLGLAEFLEILRAFREAILPARALDGRDLAPPDSGAAPAVDAQQLAARADGAVAVLRRARTTLAAAGDPRDGLVDFVFLGVPDAVPLAPRGGPALATQAAATLAEADRRLARLDSAVLDRATATPAEQVAFDQERLRTVFGPAFTALALVRPVNARELGDAVRRSDALLGADPLQALSWLQGAARVRPGAARLDGALMYAAALERPRALELKVAQLPSVAGERWVGLAPEKGVVAQGKVSIVAHLPRAFRADVPLAGLVLDEWVEVVPAAEVTTGLAFHYDNPGARPPQSVLLAVAPPGAARWDLETLERTLTETLELARLRAVDPQALSPDVMFQRALPALYTSVNLAGDAISTDFTQVKA